MTRKMSVADARREALELVQLQGLRIAIQAAIDVAGDKTAPAPARATASGLLMRAAAIGGFGKGDEAGAEKPAHEMDGHELAKAIAEVSARRGRIGAVFEEDEAVDRDAELRDGTVFD